MPFISVIIPNYNHAPFLAERIESVLQQSFRDFELIIIDDGSADESKDIIRGFMEHPAISHVILHDTNSGSPFRQWQQGIALAKGDWIWIAESDDTATAGFLERMAAHLSEDTSLVYCDSLIDTGQPATQQSFAARKNAAFATEKWSHPYTNDGKAEINESLKWECVINNASAVLFKKTVAENIIRHVSDFRFHGDWLFYILMAEKGKISYLPEPLNRYREHEKNHSKSPAFSRQSKIEHFRILDHLLKQDYIVEKKKLFRHFVKNYTGFGFLSEPAFGSRGIIKAYAKINPSLAKKTALKILSNKLKRNG